MLIDFLLALTLIQEDFLYVELLWLLDGARLSR